MSNTKNIHQKHFKSRLLYIYSIQAPYPLTALYVIFCTVGIVLNLISLEKMVL